jgi:hypothetical protein
MGRAVHLDQAVFGRPASDYRPPPPPVNEGGLELEKDPQLKKLPPWITPFNYERFSFRCNFGDSSKTQIPFGNDKQKEATPERK